jgi:hypothetical protein
MYVCMDVYIQNVMKMKMKMKREREKRYVSFLSLCTDLPVPTAVHNGNDV